MEDVHFVTHQESTLRRPLLDRYELNPSRGHVWLQRLAIWVLRRLKCYAFEHITTRTAFRFNPASFTEKILGQRSYLWRLYHREGCVLLIGSKDFSELMNAPEFQQHLSFGSPYMVNGTVYNMRVVIIPWMEGVLVVPKEFEEKIG
jgi:hypothetical protein